MIRRFSGLLSRPSSPASRRVILAGVGVFAAALLVASQAQAIKITMKRVIFEGAQRAEVLTLMNNSPDEITYRLGWRSMKMAESGGLKSVEDNEEIPGVGKADNMIVFAPRRITVPAGGAQQIRLMLRKPKDLAEGEYRSHLWIRPEEESVKFDPNPNADATKPSVQIKMLAGISVPVFVRHGNLTVSASITDASLTQKGDRLAVNLTLNRDGNRSLYGDFIFTCGGQVVHQVRGIAVYTEVSKRNLSFSLPMPKSGAGFCSSMQIAYMADANDPLFKGGKVAEATASLN